MAGEQSFELSVRSVLERGLPKVRPEKEADFGVPRTNCRNSRPLRTAKEPVNAGFCDAREKNSPICGLYGGERGIRTPGTLSGTAVFKTACFNHSHISPRGGPVTIIRGNHLAEAYEPSCLGCCGDLSRFLSLDQLP